jgi:hypothetical protein
LLIVRGANDHHKEARMEPHRDERDADRKMME